ncbi:MAG: hypothetical protein AABW59_01335 [archaeon]
MPLKRNSKGLKIKRLPRDYGIKRLIRGRAVTLEAINALTKEIGAFIKPVNYAKRGNLGNAMREVIGRNRAKDDGFAVARKKAIYVKGLLSAQYIPGKGTSKPSLLPQGGCHPASLALYETLKAIERKTKIKLNPGISRQLNGEAIRFHSTVIFELDGKYWEADPFHARIGTSIKEITKKDALSRRYVPAKPMSYPATDLEYFSSRAVNDMIESEMFLQPSS